MTGAPSESFGFLEAQRNEGIMLLGKDGGHPFLVNVKSNEKVYVIEELSTSTGEENAPQTGGNTSSKVSSFRDGDLPESVPFPDRKTEAVPLQPTRSSKSSATTYRMSAQGPPVTSTELPAAASSPPDLPSPATSASTRTSHRKPPLPPNARTPSAPDPESRASSASRDPEPPEGRKGEQTYAVAQKPPPWADSSHIDGGANAPIPPRFIPESIQAAPPAAAEKKDSTVKKRALSLPDFFQALFMGGGGDKRTHATAASTQEAQATPAGAGAAPVAPQPSITTHLRGGSFGLPKYGARGPPTWLAPPRQPPPPARRRAGTGSGSHFLVLPRQSMDSDLDFSTPRTKGGALQDSAGAVTPPVATATPAIGDEIPEDEALCRICLDVLHDNGLEAMKMQCSCRGELALAHKECAVKWFTIRGSRICDVCNTEVENLPVIIRRMPVHSAAVRNLYHSLESIDISLRDENMEDAEEERSASAWKKYPIVMFGCILLFFSFMVQILVGTLGSISVLLAMPISICLGIVVTIIAKATVTSLFVPVFAGLQFVIIVIYTQVFFTLLRGYHPFSQMKKLTAVLSIFLGAFCGLGTALGFHTIITELLPGRAPEEQEHARHQRRTRRTRWRSRVRDSSDLWGATEFEDSGSERSDYEFPRHANRGGNEGRTWHWWDRRSSAESPHVSINVGPAQHHHHGSATQQSATINGRRPPVAGAN